MKALLIVTVLVSLVFARRYYDPETGVWITPDPADQHFSPYTYGGNNPVGRIDPNGNSDININIYRNMETNSSTLGTMSVTNTANNNLLDLYTLELPNMNNAKDISRILQGDYSAGLEYSDKYKSMVLRLEDKNGRSDILIHPGNYSKDTHGCILPGETQSLNYVGQSKSAMGKIVSYIQDIFSIDRQNNEPTNINVNINDPSKK